MIARKVSEYKLCNGVWKTFKFKFTEACVQKYCCTKERIFRFSFVHKYGLWKTLKLKLQENDSSLVRSVAFYCIAPSLSPNYSMFVLNVRYKTAFTSNFCHVYVPE